MFSGINRLQYMKFILLLLLLSSSCTLIRGQSVSLTTNKSNYTPGETVIITGKGWKHLDSVQITLTHIDPLPNPLHTHNPWFVIPAGSGAIHSEWLVTDPESGTAIELRAIGYRKGNPGNIECNNFLYDPINNWCNC